MTVIFYKIYFIRLWHIFILAVQITSPAGFSHTF